MMAIARIHRARVPSMARRALSGGKFCGATMAAWRHELHRRPELAFAEVKTSQFINDKLVSFGGDMEIARGLGGMASDKANERFGMQGRIVVHTLYLLAEGFILIIFSFVDRILPAILCLVAFSICVQAAEGTTYAIVPYVVPKNVGAVAGVVGAGGNIGAVIWGLMFMLGNDGPGGYRLLGLVIMASGFLSVFLRIKDQGSIFGNVAKN